MKIGRNAPCPCGSGKKYKKCCLDKNVTPPETLHYRRLSKAFDEFMPKLIDHGISVFGETLYSIAMDEFFGWPDPDEMPDGEAIERVEPLFWPWLVFNWEFDSLDFEDSVLNFPEGATIAEHYSESQGIDRHSPGGRLIHATNRIPYSFLEVIAVQTGQSVHLKDVLTGAEMHVQENFGSELLSRGDIVYGRVVQVDGVGMFLGLSAIVLPARMKPQLIDLRRSLSGGRKKLSRGDLYDWDLKIRQFFLAMDRALHTLPELRNTDDDRMEYHKLIYEVESADLALEKLASLCTTETLGDIRATADKDKDGKVHRATFDWNRPDNPINKGMPNTMLGHLEINDSRLIVTVNSAQRAETIQQEIKKRLGPAARLRLDEISDLKALMNAGDARPPTEDELLDSPEIQQHIGQMLQAHWADWEHQKIPALGNKTPKQAVRTADGREAVEALLLDAEKMARQDPIRSTIEKDFIADVRHRLKLDPPRRRNAGTPDFKQLVERVVRLDS